MTTRYERSWNENEQVVWLDGADPELERRPAQARSDYVNPVTRLYGRSAEAVTA